MPILCWTCGVPCENRQELTEHMKVAHEAGRDYITCPACGDIIIDLIIHWSARHGSDPLPAGAQLRVSQTPLDMRHQYQKDQQKKSKRHFKDGYFPSQKNGKPMHYRSGWERTIYTILEKAFSVKRYEVEPFAIRYQWMAVKRRYFPDLRVTFIDGSQIIVEIKPMDQCPNADGTTDNDIQALNEAKWQAAIDYCNNNGMQFIVWTENAIRQLSRLPPERLTKTELCK